METFIGTYAAALAELFTTGSTEAATSCYEYPALGIRDEISWGYEDTEPLARDSGVLRQQSVAIRTRSDA